MYAAEVPGGNSKARPAHSGEQGGLVVVGERGWIGRQTKHELIEKRKEKETKRRACGGGAGGRARPRPVRAAVGVVQLSGLCAAAAEGRGGGVGRGPARAPCHVTPCEEGEERTGQPVSCH